MKYKTVDDWDIFGGKFPVFRLESTSADGIYKFIDFILVDESFYDSNYPEQNLDDIFEEIFPGPFSVGKNRIVQLKVHEINSKFILLKKWNIFEIQFGPKNLFLKSRRSMVVSKVMEFYSEQNWALSESNSIIGKIV